MVGLTTLLEQIASCYLRNIALGSMRRVVLHQSAVQLQLSRLFTMALYKS